MKRILIVEDEIKIASSIKSYLDSLGYDPLIATSGEQAVDSARRWSPDLILLDLMLPGISGEEALAVLREFTKAPIIILSAKSSESDIIGGLEGGADDYVLKPFSLKQLKARIEANLRRIEMDDASGPSKIVVGDGRIVINLESREVFLEGEAVQLTKSEFSIFAALASRPSKVFTREEIIEIAMDRDFDGFDRAVDGYIKNIRQKLRDDSKSPHIIRTVYGVGYMIGG